MTEMSGRAMVERIDNGMVLGGLHNIRVCPKSWNVGASGWCIQELHTGGSIENNIKGSP